MVKPVFKDIKASKYGVFAVQSEAQKWAILDNNGIRVSDFIYDRMEQDFPNVIEVYQGSLVGLIDEKGTQLIPVQYDKISPVGKIILTQRGAINNPMEAKVFIYRGAIVTRLGLSGYINQSGRTVLDITHERVRATANFDLDLGFVDVMGLIVVKDGKYGIVNENGQIIFPFEYDYINAANKMGFGELQQNEKKGFFSKDLKVVANRFMMI
ncbi:MAG: WG repeat-containing protein [Saprospiraceae bacterium]|nr:WG repeat-containing protein [Saprospiraceae bacterium]